MNNSMDTCNTFFPSPDTLFWMFVLYKTTVFMDISIFKATIPPADLFKVDHQVQELLWETQTESMIVSSHKTSVFSQSMLKIANLGYGSLGDRQFHSRALSAGTVKPEEHRNSVHVWW